MASIEGSVREAEYYSFIPPYMAEGALHYYQAAAIAEAEEGVKENAGLSFAELVEMQQATIDMMKQERLIQANEHDAKAVMSLNANFLRQKNDPDSQREIWDVASPSKQPVISDQFGAAASLGSGGNDYRTCFSHLKSIDAFFKSVFQIYPVPKNEHVMRVFNNCVDPNNKKLMNQASWAPRKQCVLLSQFDPKLYNTQLCIKDTLCHEFGHAVTASLGKLRYYGQSGALNESMSDVFAIMCKHYFTAQKADGPDTDWLISEGSLINTTGTGTAIRSMRYPGKAYKNHAIGSDPQGPHMWFYVNTTADFGGVHINSGIPNRAFYIASSNIGGCCWEVVGRIWFETLQQTNDDDFITFANRTLQVTKDLNYKEPIYSAIAQAWVDVGVLKSTPKYSLIATETPSKVETEADRESLLKTVWSYGKAAALVGAGFALGKLAANSNAKKKKEG